ncbi:glycerol-3-phosphate acyltransferase [Limnospira platensis]|uniref:glycerol-3-phosphate acyltransferase n=1 Tax=Limnospira platensis TaxID=118562 RepID=UPI003D6F1C65
MPPWVAGLLMIVGSFVLGGLPLTSWIVKGLTRIDLAKQGSGNVGVAAAFTQAGRVAGIFAAVAEALRGIIPVIAARSLFPSEWEPLALISLVFLVVGRYVIAKGGGVTNATWGVLVYSPPVAISAGISGLLLWRLALTIWPSQPTRARLRAMRFACLSSPVWFAAWHSLPEHRDLSLGELLAAIALALVLIIINLRQGDDFGLFMKQELLSLNDSLDIDSCGEKATRLSQLKQAGFKVPSGWVLPTIGNQEIARDRQSQHQDEIDYFELPTPSYNYPLIVRSSALGEDGDTSSAAGQYTTVGPITSEADLRSAIARCRDSYWSAEAKAYRHQRNLSSNGIAVLIQPYISAQISGVMFTRNPLDGGSQVVIEALAGEGDVVVSGQNTPVHLEIDTATETATYESLNQLGDDGLLSRSLLGDLVAEAQAIEAFYHGFPQDIEWVWDGEQIWILQTRPITNLRPIWTRKIAAEVIPGVIPPLTWSINQPLTCGVWGEIFSIVLGKKATKLDFKETATLLGSHAYFNATLLGEIFRMMGLPEQGLEFLLRGENMGKPPLKTMLASVPGLWLLVQRELALVHEFERDRQKIFAPGLQRLEADSYYETRLPSSLSLPQLIQRVDRIQELLKSATYYNILGPIGLAIRRSLFQVPEEWLPVGNSPEVASMRELQKIADRLPEGENLQVLAEQFSQNPELQQQFKQWLREYGYLSEVGTDISVATWWEQPQTFRQMLFTMAENPASGTNRNLGGFSLWQKWRLNRCYKRAIIKGEIAEVYGKLLAHLRWTFLAIEAAALESEILTQPGDIFFLKLSEIRSWIESGIDPQWREVVKRRRQQYECDRDRTVPSVVYGNLLPEPKPEPLEGALQGIPASVGSVEGYVQVCRNLAEGLENGIEKPIVVVPYTDAGWAPLLMGATAIISEVGGQLSHGAIVAREYGIPAVMNVSQAMSRLKTGQRVRVDGYRGTIEILDNSN